MNTTYSSSDGKKRCSWTSAAPEFVKYHDLEWGFPVSDDRLLFEKISLESFQSGLSWRTILAKRDNFRKAFKNFDFNKIAKFSESDVEHLLLDPGIVRHRGKIEAVINNAIRAKELVKEFGSIAAFVWRFEPKNKDFVPQTRSVSNESAELSKALKKRGWKFVGPTTVYSFMQAMGLVNDHSSGCMLRSKVDRERKHFRIPESLNRSLVK